MVEPFQIGLAIALKGDLSSAINQCEAELRLLNSISGGYGRRQQDVVGFGSAPGASDLRMADECLASESEHQENDGLEEGEHGSGQELSVRQRGKADVVPDKLSPVDMVKRPPSEQAFRPVRPAQVTLLEGSVGGRATGVQSPLNIPVSRLDPAGHAGPRINLHDPASLLATAPHSQPTMARAREPDNCSNNQNTPYGEALLGLSRVETDVQSQDVVSPLFRQEATTRIEQMGDVGPFTGENKKLVSEAGQSPNERQTLSPMISSLESQPSSWAPDPAADTAVAKTLDASNQFRDDRESPAVRKTVSRLSDRPPEGEAGEFLAPIQGIVASAEGGTSWESGNPAEDSARSSPMAEASPMQRQPAPYQDHSREEPRDLDGQALGGNIFLDGALVGRWISHFLKREAERPSVGPTGYDIRRGRLFPGPSVGV